MYKIQELHPQYVTNETGQKIAVLLPIKVFEEMVEDLTDMAAIIDRQDESTVPHEELIKKLKKNGLL